LIYWRQRVGEIALPEIPRVFISYSHDGEDHETRVLDLCNRLREDGIDAEIDQYVDSPEGGWPAWCERQIASADFVLLVCTETYNRRVGGREEPESGLGVLWEARIIRQLIYDAGAATEKFIPVLFDGSSPDHIPTAVKGATRWLVDEPGGYEGLFRQITRQPKVKKPMLGKIAPMPLRERRSGPAVEAPEKPLGGGSEAARGVPAVGAALHPRVDDVFVGREPELEELAGCLLPEDETERRPVAVMGMGGVGKSYLVDRFFWQHRKHFPGGYHQLALDAENPGSGEALLAMLADRLKLPASAGDAAIAAALREPLALVHVENVDTPAAALAVGDLGLYLPGCALVASARLGTVATGTDWGAVKLESFDEAAALEQFRQELGASAPEDDALRPLVHALGGLPLALHLAAGYLYSGETAEGFLRLLRRRGLSLEPVNPADPTFRERSRGRLGAVFALSLTGLERAAEAAGQAPSAWLAAFRALAHAPAAGFGESLGAAIAGLDIEEFADLARAACALSLLDRVRRKGCAIAFRLHPLLAEVGAKDAGDAVLSRITNWFCERLPREGDQGRRWGDIHAEPAALIDWLTRVPASERVRVERAGSRFAITNGPYHAWLRFCEDTLRLDLTDDQRSDLLWTLGNVAWRGGLADRALKAAEEKRTVDLRRHDERGVAVAWGLVADIRFAQGASDEALRIRREEELPVYDRLGDIHSGTVTRGQIADILYACGEPDEALRIYREDVLPAFERLGDARERAITLGKIGDVLFARGKVEEALRIRKEEQLPAYEGLGDARLRAVTLGQIADELAQRGELDEAIRMRRDEVLPALQRIGDVSAEVSGRWWLASHLLRRGKPSDRAEARELLVVALEEAQRLRLPEAEEIAARLKQRELETSRKKSPTGTRREPQK